MTRATGIDLMADGYRIGRIEKIGLRWQAFRFCPKSDELKYCGTYSSKSDAKAAVRGSSANAA